MRAYELLAEFFDPERKYTGGGSQPPQPPNRRNGRGPWDDDDSGGQRAVAFREFCRLLKTELDNIRLIRVTVDPAVVDTPLLEAVYRHPDTGVFTMYVEPYTPGLQSNHGRFQRSSNILFIRMRIFAEGSNKETIERAYATTININKPDYESGIRWFMSKIRYWITKVSAGASEINEQKYLQYNLFVEKLEIKLAKLGLKVEQTPNMQLPMYILNYSNKDYGLRIDVKFSTKDVSNFVECWIHYFARRNPSEKDLEWITTDHVLRVAPDADGLQQCVGKISDAISTTNERAAGRKNLDEQTLTEAATDIVYHYMSLYDAVRTLKNGYYSLDSSTGVKQEEELSVPFRPWYLATTRSKVGDYTIRQSFKTGAVFELDGRWLNQHYQTKPVDYWASITPERIKLLKPGEWAAASPESKRSMTSYDPKRSSESEDRVFSKKPYIPLHNSTLSVHVLMDKENDNERRAYEAAQVFRMAQQRDIPAYLYDDKSKWLTQREQYRIDPNSQYGKELLSGVEYTPHTRMPYSSDYWGNLNFVVELIEKQPPQELSKPASKLVYNLLQYSDSSSTIANSLHNAARNPENEDYEPTIAINDYMVRNRIRTVKELCDKLAQKWQRRNES
jgi:hypothetical protein